MGRRGTSSKTSLYHRKQHLSNKKNPIITYVDFDVRAILAAGDRKVGSAWVLSQTPRTVTEGFGWQRSWFGF
jgi:hypothetical protein